MGFRIKEEPEVIDPVCGMEIADDFISHEYKGIKYYFCSENCKVEFESNPNKFLA
jgi:YHS domain-containing protein